MGDNTKYGFCRGCQTWKKRDDMLSINVDVYDRFQNKELIRIRMCPLCHSEFVKMLKGRQWNNELVTEKEIKMDIEMASNSDLEFDISSVNPSHTLLG